MASPTVTYTFANGTTADASAVNQNFSDLIAAMTDGSKSFSIDALTCAGTATLNGNVALGNATGDTITVNGVFAGTGGDASATQRGLTTTAAQSFAGNKTFTGFTSLGGGVALKCKKVTSTTASAEGGVVNFAHGLTSSKIVAYNVMVWYSASAAVHPEFVSGAAGYQFSASFDGTNISVALHPTNSENILSKSISALIWYEE